MHTKRTVSDAISTVKYRFRRYADEPDAARELGGLDMLESLLWQHGGRDAATLSAYAMMADAAGAELERIADGLSESGGGMTQSQHRVPAPGDSDGMNRERAEWAGLALKAFIHATGTDEPDALGDLLANLMHWSDQENYDFDAALDRARMHYEAETAGVDCAVCGQDHEGDAPLACATGDGE